MTKRNLTKRSKNVSVNTDYHDNIHSIKQYKTEYLETFKKIIKELDVN